MRGKSLVLIFFLIVSIVSSISLNAQKKNYVFGTFGSLIFTNTWTINYERNLISSDNAAIKKARLKLSYGSYEEGAIDYGQTWNIYTGSCVFLFLKGNKYIELSPGLSYRVGTGAIDAKIPENDRKFVISVAARLETEYFIVRAGFGTQELFFLSLGFRF